MLVNINVKFTKHEKEIIHQASEIIDELADKLDKHGISKFEELDYDELKFISKSLDSIKWHIIQDWGNK